MANRLRPAHQIFDKHFYNLGTFDTHDIHRALDTLAFELGFPRGWAQMSTLLNIKLPKPETKRRYYDEKNKKFNVVLPFSVTKSRLRELKSKEELVLV